MYSAGRAGDAARSRLGSLGLDNHEQGVITREVERVASVASEGIGRQGGKKERKEKIGSKRRGMTKGSSFLILHRLVKRAQHITPVDRTSMKGCLGLGASYNSNIQTVWSD